MWKKVLFSFPALATISSAVLLYGLKQYRAHSNQQHHARTQQQDDEHEEEHDVENDYSSSATSSSGIKKPKQPLHEASSGERRFLDTKRWACISRPQ